MEDVETTPTLPLLCIPSRILFPGETLPMHIFNPHVRMYVRVPCGGTLPVHIFNPHVHMSRLHGGMG